MRPIDVAPIRRLLAEYEKASARVEAARQGLRLGPEGPPVQVAQEFWEAMNVRAHALKRLAEGVAPALPEVLSAYEIFGLLVDDRNDHAFVDAITQCSMLGVVSLAEVLQRMREAIAAQGPRGGCR